MDTSGRSEALNAVAGVLNQRKPEPHKPEQDTDGHECPITLVGRTFVHGKRGTIYKVSGYSWDGERDLWMVHFFNVNPNVSAVPYSRKVGNFIGKLADGYRRFVEIHDTASINPPSAEMPAAAPAIPLKMPTPRPRREDLLSKEPRAEPLGEAVSSPYNQTNAD